MKKLLITYCLLLFSVLAFSQSAGTATGIPYECGFEETDDLSAWTINPLTPNAHDKWMVGTAVHSEGKRSLYVSANGSSPSYSDHRNTVVAYLSYRFPAVGKYDISFDWRGFGSNASCLHVMVCPKAQLTAAGSQYNLSNIASETQMLSSNAPVLEIGNNADLALYGSETWQNVSLTQSVNVNSLTVNQDFAILFVWDNQLNGRKDSVFLSGFAIDNFQINSASLKKPTNVMAIPQCEDSTMLVTWESGLQVFDVEYRQYGDANWRKASGLEDGMEGFTRTDGTNCSFVLTRILEGSYDVRVRGVSPAENPGESDLRTSFVYQTNILVYCPDNHCINYIDLYSPNVLCQYGHHPGAQAGATPYDNIGVIDYGPDAEGSRHTLHIDPEELDPRTDSMLHTVPTGALASVRLGNWKTGGEAESITYDILVDTTTQGILIVKYAIVFENPNGHPPEDEPAFRLEILKPDGSVIDELCGQASFTYSDADTDPDHWHMTKDGNVAWKDWTNVGVSLMDFHGQSIKVRFTTLDCGWSGHYAYAYFTVDCANAHIETENCGNDASLTCIAPDGFAYEWSDETGTVVSTDRVFMVDAGLHTYTCKVSFVEEPSCYFKISTISAPRFPVPDYTFERLYGECTSRLKFTNTSHVMNKFDGYENHTSEPCSDYHWEFRNIATNEKKVTDAKSPIYKCPDEGGQIEVTYTCYIGVNNSCDSMRVDTINVPSILSTPTEFHYTSCSESPVKFNDQWFNTDTVYTGRFKNFAGCDSLSTLYLTILPKPDDRYLHDSICSDGSITIGGRKYNQPCDNMLIMLKTADGCDSAVYLTLTVNQRIETDVHYLPFACADDGEFYINYDVNAGVYDSLHIAFSTSQLRDTTIYDPTVNSIAIPYPADITPGHYTAEITFYQFCCGRHVEKRDIDVRYSSSIVEQKWNDVLTLLSPAYNGGFEFLDYQWFKNNELLPGETHSYLYQPLDTTAEYHVVVTRKDGVQIATCPLQPVYHEQQSKYPSVVKAGQKMRMYMAQETTIWYYTVSGQLYSSFTLPQGHVTMDAPNIPGVYVLRAVDKQGETQAQVLLVE